MADPKQETAVTALDLQELAELRILNKKTTLSEFLLHCHKHSHMPLRVRSQPRYTAVFHSTARKNYVPERLAPWTKFPQLARALVTSANGRLVGLQGPDGKQGHLFDPAVFIEFSGVDHCRKAMANEADIRYFQHNAVENRIEQILEQLAKTSGARSIIGEACSVEFENHPDSLSDLNPEVQETLMRNPQNPTTGRRPSIPATSDSEAAISVHRTRAYQSCVYEIGKDGKRQLLFVVDYKAPHKLGVDSLRLGLRSMDIVKDVLAHTSRPGETEDCSRDGQRLQKKRRIEQSYTKMTPTEKEEFKYEADQAVAALMIQTFHHMLENGLSYSYVTTGQAYVFLHITAEDPTTFYYHLSTPDQHREDIAMEDTAIGQVLGLALLAFKDGQPRDHFWRQKAMAQLKKYSIHPFDDVLSGRLSASAGSIPAPVSEYKSRFKPFVARDDPSRNTRRRDELSDTESDPLSSKRIVTEASDKHGTSKPAQTEGTDPEQCQKQRDFCTQQCLLGMVKGYPLDMNCPNVEAHQTAATTQHVQKSYHTITATEFPQLVTSQLARSLDMDCKPMGIQGARGALFHITLSSHGYTFVAKGTVYAFVPDLLHEGRVYQHLERLQGCAVPVYLGNINLVHKYYLTVGVRILHMMLLSWGGESCDNDPVWYDNSDCEVSMQDEAWKTWCQVRDEGVNQKDFRDPNLLWNEEGKRVMLIDFERAVIINRASNKKKTKLAAKKRSTKDLEEQEKFVPGDTKKVLQESSPNKNLASSSAVKRKIDQFAEGGLSDVEAGEYGQEVTGGFSKRLRTQEHSNLVV